MFTNPSNESADGDESRHDHDLENTTVPAGGGDVASNPETRGGDPAEAPRAGADAGREDLLVVWGGEEAPTDGPIELVRLGQDPTPLVPFTSDMSRLAVHYCEEPEIRDYVHCNGDGCILCGIGRRKDERCLLPVFNPTTRLVEVLAVPKNSRPGALLPQLLPILKSPRRMAMAIHRPDRMSYRVKPIPLADDLDDGADVVAGFQRRWDRGEIVLADVYPRHSNEDLAEIEGIKARIRFLRPAH